MQKAERAAMTRLIDQLGAEITLTRDPWTPMGRVIRGCLRRDAEDEAIERGQVPPAWPNGSYTGVGRVTILVPPNAEEQRVRRWGVGRPAVMLRQALNMAGLTVSEDCAYVAADGSKAMWEAVVAADTPYLLFVGGEGLKVWRDDVRIQQLAGGMYPIKNMAGDAWLAGVVAAPEAVLRGSMETATWRFQIVSFVEKVLEDRGLEGITWSCRQWDKAKEKACGEHAHGWDRLGLPWCRKHLVAGWDGAEKNKSRGAQMANRSMQEGLGI